MGRAVTRAERKSLLIQNAFQLNLYWLAGLHGDCEGDGFEAGNEIEGSFFWDGWEALWGGGADGECAVWFCDADGFGGGLCDRFAGSRDDGKDELERGLGGGVDACGDFDGGLGEVVGEAIVRFACGWGLVGGGEEAAYGVEGNLSGSCGASQGGFEVA
jgi:hypothetical protein